MLAGHRLCSNNAPPPRCLFLFNETFYSRKYPVDAFRVNVATIVLISLTLISTSFFPLTLKIHIRKLSFLDASGSESVALTSLFATLDVRFDKQLET